MTLEMQKIKHWKLIQTGKGLFTLLLLPFTKTQKRCLLQIINYMMRRQALFKRPLVSFL